MNTEPLDTLWPFANSVYHQAGVQQACLQLQDDYAVDIPLLLFCCWVSGYHGVMATEQTQQVNDLAQQWRLHCIAPLRDIRRSMKRINLALATSDPAWLMVREQVKTSELAAEKSLLEGLEAITYIPDVTPNSVSIPLMDSILTNIDRCIGWQPLSSKPAMTAIATILCAAYPDLQYHALIQSMKMLTGN